MSNHDELMSNYFAQPDALAYGKVHLSLLCSSKLYITWKQINQDISKKVCVNVPDSEVTDMQVSIELVEIPFFFSKFCGLDFTTLLIYHEEYDH